MPVAVVKYDQTLAALRRAIELCEGFSGLNPDSKVILKPNVVIGGRKSQRPDGVVTTLEVMEGLLTLLREAGCRDITIAEGGAIQPELNLNTPRAFEWSGIKELAERLGIPTIDLNEGPFTALDFYGVKIEIASALLEAGFIVNVPVLKTHQLTKISMGLKNLKGVLSNESKKNFHRHGLERFIAILGTKIPVSLTVIDGTFAIQKGPVGDDVHRMNLLVAGKDILDVDIVGAHILGIDPAEVGHVKLFADMTGQTVDLNRVEVRGENPADVQKPLAWASTWPLDLMKKYNISGIHMETPGYSNCSGCGMGIFVAVNNFFRENVGATFDGVEICAGQEPVASPAANKVFCLGKCACDTNKDHPHAIKIKGCPPSIKKIYETLKEELVP
ncbi:MAG: hypothetical protein VR69_12055 [Peptococcaceae bacterium BRH_c4b]|nr:MAG: hypothetical protein VR69_12055 [Peptococcaceae bacterium BRH_c4b]